MLAFPQEAQFQRATGERVRCSSAPELQCSSAPVVQRTSQHQVSEQCPSNVVSAIGIEVVVAYSKITCVCVNGFGFPDVVQEFDLIKHPNEGPNRVPFDCDIGLESRSRPLDQWGYFLC